ncbi:MAG: class I SAM-dependent methyltransferase, partial [Burkholderiaceae bacterium]
MPSFDGFLQRKLDALTLPMAVVLPGGGRVGAAGAAAITLRLGTMTPLAHLATGDVGKVAEDYVEGRLDFAGSVRDLAMIATQMVGDDPTRAGAGTLLVDWWHNVLAHARSRARHEPHLDAAQVQFHYDVSDDFYALWLDPRRLYSCAYFRNAGMTLAQAQEAKLDHICRKLMLQPGERFLDVG